MKRDGIIVGRTKTALQKRKRTWIIATGIIVLILIFALGKPIAFDVVKPGLVQEGIDRKSALEKCKEENYFMVRFSNYNTGLMYVLSEGEDEGVEVELTGNTPLTELSNVFRDGRNEFLIYGHEMNSENKTKNAVVNGYPEAPYTIVVENWEIITPIYRDYTYSKHERFFAPSGYFDEYDLQHGDYDAEDERSAG